MGRSWTIRPAGPDRWSDVEQLFGERGACAGCWCRWWTKSASEFARDKGAANRAELAADVRSGREPGLIAFDGSEPVGWCAVAPRTNYPRLERSRILSPVDDVEVWAVVCFFVARTHRRRGVSRALLREARHHVGRRGGRFVEGYPVDPRGGKSPDAFVWTGLSPAFEAAGFREIARRSPTRPIMRAPALAPARKK